jgi:hypothetical protein
MGEIKSTLELAMERVQKLDVSSEEMEQLRREEYTLKARGMVNRYLNRGLHIEGLIKELDRFNGKQKDIIFEALIFEFVNAVSISQNNERILKAIEILKKDKAKPHLDAIDKLSREFKEEKTALYKELEDEILEKLDKKGISGTAVQPNIDSYDIWHQNINHQKIPFPVIPAKAGIQCFQAVANHLDSGFHRSDDFLRIHLY